MEQTNQDQPAYAQDCGCTNQVNVVFVGEAVEEQLKASAPPRKCDANLIGEKLEI